METVIITGGTGLVGTALSKLLVQNGYTVVLLSRSIPALAEDAPSGNVESSAIRKAYWDPAKKQIDKPAIEQADYIINLAGAGVAEKRWTPARKKEILESRVQSGQLLVKALREIPNKVKSVINASAIGWYGADVKENNSVAFTEADPADNGFLGSACLQWEDSIKPVTELQKRLVILRIGIVLSNEGGALAEFKKPLRLGLAAILGNGRQIISWIHIDDLCRLFLYALKQQGLNGIYNAVAPEPVSNAVLTIQLAKKKNGRLFIPVKVPAIALKMILGEMSVEVLKSATVSSRRIESSGFKFLYPSINKALEVLCAS
jgi:uncharacterized protein (TIGR01777 family)